MKENGTVIKKLGEHLYAVQVTRQEQCSGCHACGLGDDNSLDQLSLVGYSENKLRKGQPVSIEVRQGSILTAAFWLYIYPLLLFMVGTLLGTLWLSDSQAVLIGLLALVIGLISAKKSDHKMANRIYHIK